VGGSVVHKRGTGLFIRHRRYKGARTEYFRTMGLQLAKKGGGEAKQETKD